MYLEAMLYLVFPCVQVHDQVVGAWVAIAHFALVAVRVHRHLFLVEQHVWGFVAGLCRHCHLKHIKPKVVKHTNQSTSNRTVYKIIGHDTNYFRFGKNIYAEKPGFGVCPKGYFKEKGIHKLLNNYLYLYCQMIYSLFYFSILFKLFQYKMVGKHN